MLRKALITTILIGAALASNGTGPAAGATVMTQDLRPIPSVPPCVNSGVELSADPGEEVREEFHQTYPLSNTGRVSLENINGGVQIKVWDRAAVQLDAIKKAYRSERLAEAKIQVESSEDNIRIKTEYPNWNQTFKSGRGDRYDNPASVEYTLTIPRKAALESIELVNGSLDIDGVEGSVKASSINGPVTARGLLGDVKLSTINGPLQANFTQLSEARPIALGSVNGPVSLVIPSDSNASVRAGTVHGGIQNDFGMRVRHGEYVGHNLDGQIGNGGARIKLGNVNGSITINHAQDGRTLSPATSMAIEKEKDEYARLEQDVARQVEQATATATAIEASEAVRVNSAKIAREAQREAQRQVDVALREAQREIQQAQREIQRENRHIREQVRIATVVRGRGMGSGSGEGYGDNRLSAQESKSFVVSGSPRVNVSTFDGNITVHGWDKSEVMYTATKLANVDEDLRRIGIQTEQQGSSVSVLAMADDGRTGSANLEVWVPRRSSIHVSSDDGALKLEGVTGDITLRTGDGSIDVNDGGGQLQVNTGDGIIQVLRFDGQLDARTGDGTIKLDGNFNGLSARTGDGAISLSVPSNSNFTVETNADNEFTNEGLSITEDIAPSRRVKRWKVGNGGKVFVLNTGDGAIVLRSR